MPEQRSELQQIMDHFDILAESLASKIDQLGESVIMLRDEVRGGNETSARYFARIHRQRLADLGKLDQPSTTLDEHSATLDERSVDLDEHSEQLRHLDSRVDQLRQEMHREPDATRVLIGISYVELDRRMTTLERSLAILSYRVGAIEAQAQAC